MPAHPRRPEAAARGRVGGRDSGDDVAGGRGGAVVVDGEALGAHLGGGDLGAVVALAGGGLVALAWKFGYMIQDKLSYGNSSNYDMVWEETYTVYELSKDFCLCLDMEVFDSLIQDKLLFWEQDKL